MFLSDVASRWENKGPELKPEMRALSESTYGGWWQNKGKLWMCCVLRPNGPRPLSASRIARFVTGDVRNQLLLGLYFPSVWQFMKINEEN